MNRTLVIIIATVCAAAAAPRAADAAVPARVAVQGFLTDTAGAPIDGSRQIELRLYDVASGGTAWFAETQVVGIDRGTLTVYLGAVQTLDLAGFSGGAAYLGITLQGEAEMSPRLPIGSVPYASYASYADECGSVPTGSVMYFDLDQCPTGWSPFDAARGRAIVGTPASGTRGGTVGNALTDLENRVHTHDVNPAAVTSLGGGAHTHTIDPPATTSTFVNLSHTHTVDPASVTVTGGSHNHLWATWNQSTLVWSTYASDGVTVNQLVDYTNGFTNSGSGSYPLEDSGGVSANLYTADSTSHSHSVDIGPTVSGAANIAMNHAHSVDLAPLSSSAPDHTHSVDVASTTSTAAAATTPYVQLLACRKD